MIVHCSQGRDRTGIIVAVLLRALGTDERSVTLDYAETDVRLEVGSRLHRAVVNTGFPLLHGSAHARAGESSKQLLATPRLGSGVPRTTASQDAGRACGLWTTNITATDDTISF